MKRISATKWNLSHDAAPTTVAPAGSCFPQMKEVQSEDHQLRLAELRLKLDSGAYRLASDQIAEKLIEEMSHTVPASSRNRKNG